MRTFIISLFLLFSFTLTAIAAQMVVHTHAVTSDDHAGHSHHDHLANDTLDADKQASKNIKTHGHDGQVHEYIRDDRLPVRGRERIASLPIPLGKIPVSENIKPPLEPPTRI